MHMPLLRSPKRYTLNGMSSMQLQSSESSRGSIRAEDYRLQIHFQSNFAASLISVVDGCWIILLGR